MQNQRLNFREMLDAFFGERMKSVYTCIPAHVVAFDPKTQLAQLELGIKRVDIDGKTYTPPPIIDSPVLFPGDGWAVEYQIDPGCEGLALFSQRCIDGWVSSGGVADNPLARFHDMQDALFIPGFRPMPTVLPKFQNNGIRLRNRAGAHWVWLKNDGSITIENGAGHIRMAADGTVTINGVTIGTDSNVTTPADVVASGISLSSHTHPGDSGGTTGAPN